MSVALYRKEPAECRTHWLSELCEMRHEGLAWFGFTVRWAKAARCAPLSWAAVMVAEWAAVMVAETFAQPGI